MKRITLILAVATAMTVLVLVASPAIARPVDFWEHRFDERTLKEKHVTSSSGGFRVIGCNPLGFLSEHFRCVIYT